MRCRHFHACCVSLPRDPPSLTPLLPLTTLLGSVAEDWANAAIELSQRLGFPPFDAALQKFLRGADELAWKSREGGATVPGAVIFDAAGEWVFYATVEFGGESFPVPHRLRLSSDGVNAAMLCEGHPQAGGLVIRGKGTWEAVQGGAAISVALSIEVHRSPTDAAQQSEPDLEPEPEPLSNDGSVGSPTTAAATTVATAEAVVSTQDCKLLLKKDLQEASGLNALITRADAP
eukprot:COSAG02_NODE_4801_length_4960_cov_3.266406_6_plen_232_part_00